MNFMKLAQKRYSCRQMSDRPVEKEKLEAIIEAGRVAPTAVNQQPVKIFWMASEEAQEKIHQVTGCIFGAKNFLVVGYELEGGWVRPFDEHHFAEVDASIVATHMMLAVEDLGLATTWVGFFDAPKLRQLCPEMEGYGLVAIFPVGYAAEEGGEPSPRHEKRKSTEEILTVL